MLHPDPTSSDISASAHNTHRTGRRWRFVLLVAAIGLYSLYAFLNGPTFDWDYGYQLGAAQQIVAGNGVTNAYVSTLHDLSNIEYRSVTWWTPGESWFAAALLRITGDIWWSAYLLEVVHIALFFAAWFIILEALEEWLNPKACTLVWLSWVLIFAPIVSGTDQAALAWYSLSLALCLLMVRAPRWMFVFSLGAGLAVGMAAIIRYAYAPMLAVLPVVWAYYALRTGQWRWLRAVLPYGIGAALPMLAILLFFRSATGANPAQMDSGFFLNQLTTLYPFPASSVGASFGVPYIADKLALGKPLLTGVMWLISGVLVAAFIAMYAKPIWKPQKTVPTLALFGLHGMATCSIIVVTLAYLTVRYLQFGDGWTFGSEMRYYAPTWGYFSVAAFALLTQSRASGRQRLLILLVIGVVTLCLGAAAFTRAANVRHLLTSAPRYGGTERITSPLYQVLTQAAEDGRPVVFVTGNLFDPTKVRSEVALANAAFYDGTLDADASLDAQQPVTLVLGVPIAPAAPDDQIEILSAWQQQYAAEPIGSIPGYMTFYALALPLQEQ
jgi:hypothetical protein